MPTRTVRQAGGDFSTLAGALADVGTVPGDIISIEGFWTVDDTAAATVGDSNITIQTDDDSYHFGVYDEANRHYRLEVSGASHNITVNNTGCIIDGLALKSTSITNSQECIRMAASSGVLTVKNFVLWSTTITPDKDGLHIPVPATVNLENGMAYGFPRAGVNGSIAVAGTVTCNVNCLTIWDCAKDAGDASGGGINIRRVSALSTYVMNVFNTIIVDSNSGAAGDYNEDLAVAPATWNIDDCISSDASISALDGGAVGALENRTATDNPSPGGGDFVILVDITTTPFNLLLQNNPTDNDAQDAHSDISGAGMNLPTLDITREVRSRESGKVDIGADAFPLTENLPTFGQRIVVTQEGNRPSYGQRIGRTTD